MTNKQGQDGQELDGVEEDTRLSRKDRGRLAEGGTREDGNLSAAESSPSVEQLNSEVEEAVARVEESVSEVTRQLRSNRVWRNLLALLVVGLVGGIGLFVHPIAAALAVPPVIGLTIPLCRLEGLAQWINQFREKSGDWWWFGWIGERTDGIQDEHDRAGVRTVLYLYSIEAIPIVLYVVLAIIVGVLVVLAVFFIFGLLLDSLAK